MGSCLTQLASELDMKWAVIQMTSLKYCNCILLAEAEVY